MDLLQFHACVQRISKEKGFFKKKLDGSTFGTCIFILHRAGYNTFNPKLKIRRKKKYPT